MNGSWVGLLACTAACGRIAFDHQLAPSDASLDSATNMATALPVLTDNFEDGSRAAMWFSYDDQRVNGSDLAETGGELRVTYATSLDDSYAGYTAPGYDLTGRALWVELAAPPPTPLGGSCYMTLDQDPVSLQIGTVGAQLQVGASGVTLLSMTVPFADMRWWRMRESAGEVFFEIGRDGRTWTVLARIATPAFITNVSVNLGGGTYDAIPGGEMCRYAGLGVAP